MTIYVILVYLLTLVLCYIAGRFINRDIFKRRLRISSILLALLLMLFGSWIEVFLVLKITSTDLGVFAKLHRFAGWLQILSLAVGFFTK